MRVLDMDRQEKFISLMMREQADLRAFLSSVIWDRHRCEDLLQEVALVLWRKFDTYDESRSFGAWARGVALNLVRQTLDDARRRGLALSEAALQALDQAYEDAPRFAPERQEALRACLGTLPPQSRNLLTLRYERSMTLAAIAGSLQKSLEAVHMLLSRIRVALLRCVQQRLSAVERS
jgi:RNA polymerase sigma-70 factor (ECF subfamily)